MGHREQWSPISASWCLIAHPGRLQVDERREYCDKVMEIEGILEFKDKFLPLSHDHSRCTGSAGP